MGSTTELSEAPPGSDDAIAALGEAIAETAAILDAGTHRFLSQVRAFDEAGGWARAGALSCAHWLSWRVGLDLGAAREKVRVARKLAALPNIDRALSEGSISYSKVRAMTRVATASNEADLLTMARTTTGAQLERICRLARQVESLAGKDPREVEDDQRHVVSRRTDDGMVSIKIRLHPDEAARVMKALEVASGGGNLADGAVAIAESVLVAGGAPCAAGRHASASAALRASAAPDDRREVVDLRSDGSEPCREVSERAVSGRETVRSPVEVVVHISAETLLGETELGDGLSAEVARRLLCDAGLVPMLEDERGKTIDVGRKTRSIPAALWRALRSRDRGCRFPGCTNTRFVDAHHLVHWIDGGETSLDNTLLVCRRHHRHLHEFGFDVDKVGDELLFRDASGCIVPPQGERPVRVVDPFDWLREGLSESGIAISSETNASGWDGQRIDHDLCVAALFRGESLA
jgi:hypothetical protein